MRRALALGIALVQRNMNENENQVGKRQSGEDGQGRDL